MALYKPAAVNMMSILHAKYELCSKCRAFSPLIYCLFSSPGFTDSVEVQDESFDFNQASFLMRPLGGSHKISLEKSRIN